MTLYEFNLKSDLEKYTIVFSKGTFIDSVEYKKNKTALYGIDKFYVEIIYDSTSNEIIDHKTFKSGTRLNKYLKDIEIDI